MIQDSRILMLKSSKKNNVLNNVLLTLIILLSLSIIFPFIYLSFYNFPGALDDLFIASIYSDKSFFGRVYEWYFGELNGRYANAIITQLPGYSFMNSWFAKIFPIVLIVGLFGGLLYMFDSINKKEWKNNITYSLLVLSFFVAFLPDIHLFHWYSGATVYILPAIFYLFLIGLMIRYFNKETNIFHLITSIILLFLIIGSHESWMITTIITISLFFLNSLLKKERIIWHSYLILLCTIIFSLFVFLGPGTEKRLDRENHFNNKNMYESFTYSFVCTWKAIKDWFLNPGFLVSIIGFFLIPKKKSNRTFKSFVPTVLLFITFIFLIYCGFFLLIYFVTPENVTSSPRGYVPNFLVSTLFLLLIIYNISWNEKIRIIINILNANIGYSIICLGLILGVTTSPNVILAYDDIISGNAKKESYENLWVQDFLKNCAEYELKIPSFNTNTNTIMPFIISLENNTYTHWLTYMYFDKDITQDTTQSIEDFIKLNSARYLFKLDSKEPTSYIYKFEKNRALSTPEKKILIQMILENNCDSNLIFDYGTKVDIIPLNDILIKNRIINYEYSIIEKENINDVKVYVNNTSKEPLYINYMKVFLK